MKTTWTTLWRDLSKVPPFVLISGNDADHVATMARSFVAVAYPEHNVVWIPSQDVVRTPQVLSQTSSAGADLFGDAPTATVMGIEAATDKLGSIIAPLMESPHEHQLRGPLIAWSAKLSKTSSLRKLAETQSWAAFVPSYAPDKGFFEGYLSHLSHQHAVALSDDVRHIIGYATGWDTGRLPYLVVQLKLYAATLGTQRLDVAQVWDLILPPEPEMETFLSALLRRSPQDLAPTLAIWSKEATISTIYGMTFYLTKLLELHELCATGQTADRAVYNLRPPLPPHVSALLCQAQRVWRPKEIVAMMARLAQAQHEAKVTSLPACATPFSLLMRAQQS